MPRKRGPGRPPKKPSERRDKDVRLPVTGAEHRQLAQAAKAAGKGLSDYIRAMIGLPSAHPSP